MYYFNSPVVDFHLGRKVIFKLNTHALQDAIFPSFEYSYVLYFRDIILSPSRIWIDCNAIFGISTFKGGSIFYFTFTY